MKNVRLSLSVLLLAVVAAAAPLVVSKATRFVIMNGAANAWQVDRNSSGQLVVTSNSGANGAVLTIDDLTGAVLPRARTSAQIITMTPSAAGEVLFNSTVAGVCMSTGTTIAAYVYVSSYTTATSGVRVPCY